MAQRVKTVDTLKEAEEAEKKRKKEEKELEKLAAKEAGKEVKEKKARRVKKRSKRYLLLKTKIDRTKLYPTKEAVQLLLENANSKMDETVEIHVNTRVDKLSGSVSLPHGTGKTQKVAIADDKVLDEIMKGKIDFDILIAEPKMMPRVAKAARILGPKGLMPSPKTNTISPNPEELKKKLEGGETRYKTEPKAPLIHFVIGRASFGQKKIQENLDAFLKTVKSGNIIMAYLKSTHSPSLKLQIK